MTTSEETLNRLMSLHPKVIDLSLERMQRLLDCLGNPENSLPPVIHVAGTNGKGSTCAFLRSMLEANGDSVHVYSSPHLVRFHERIRLSGALVSESQLDDALNRVETANAGAEITFFEITTVAAMVLFSEHSADYLVLEVGLGGRLDTTNVIPRAIASVITPIAVDHEGFLGSDISGIAREKAGIFKRLTPAICAEQADNVRAVLEEEATKLAVPLVIGGQDWSVFEERGRMVFQDLTGLLDLNLPRMTGYHQLTNAGLAIATLRTLNPDFSSTAIQAGLGTVSWPGRMQHLSHGKLVELLPANAELWIDGGHNPHAGTALASTLASLEERAPRPLVMICGMLDTKNPAGYFMAFTGLVHDAMTVSIQSSNAGIDPMTLASAARDEGIPAAAMPDLISALERIATTHRDQSPRVLICGSLYLAGEALELNGTLPE